MATDVLKLGELTRDEVPKELRAEGKTIVTRATYTDASASISHHRPIVELFLLNYTETEIAQRLNHTLGRVEG